MSMMPPPPPTGNQEISPVDWSVDEPVYKPMEPEDVIDEVVDETELVDEPTEFDVKHAKADNSKYIVRKVSGRVAQLMKGEISIADLDDEELARGQLRGSDGRFRGRASNMVPRAMHDEMVRRLLERGVEKLREDYFSAIDTMLSIMKDTNNDPNIRLKAADMVQTRIAGKPVDKVEMSVAVKPWQQAMVAIAREAPTDLGELVQEEDEDDR